MRYPPGPTSTFGSYLALRRSPLEFLTRAAREYGDIVHLQLGKRHDYLLNNPEYIKQALLAPEGMARSSPRPLRKLLRNGLLTTTGEFHHQNRRLLQPLFHREQVNGWTGIMEEAALRQSARWSGSETVEIAGAMLRLSLEIIVRILFGADIEGEARYLGRAVEVICKRSNQATFPGLLELLLQIPRLRERQLDEALARLDTMIYRMIGERHERAGHDLASAMVRLCEREDGFSTQQIRDELVTLIAAGHETIGNALAWTWHLIASHPEVEKKFHDEVDGVVGDGRVTGEQVSELCYTRMILAEALRLYPPVWVFSRRPLGSYSIAGYEVPPGSYLQISPYVTQRDPRYFPDPEQFDPERWRAEENLRRSSFTYLPFAAGVHRCIGEGLAWTEGVIVLATLAQRWRLRMVSSQRVEAQPLITLRPRYGMLMRLEPRQGKRPLAPSGDRAGAAMR